MTNLNTVNKMFEEIIISYRGGHWMTYLPSYTVKDLYVSKLDTNNKTADMLFSLTGECLEKVSLDSLLIHMVWKPYLYNCIRCCRFPI